MPRASDGDNKQGLIFTLVGFVLLSIILAVTTFTGYNGQQKLEDERRAADSEKAKMQAERDKEKFQKLLAKAYMGVLEKNEIQDFTSLSSSFFGKEEFNAIANQPAVKPLGWDPQKQMPATTMAAELDRLRAALATAQQNIDQLKLNLDKQRQAYQEQLNERDAQLKVARDGQSKAEAEIVQLKTQRSLEFQQLQEAKAQADALVEQMSKQLNEVRDDLERKLIREKQEVKTLLTELERERDNKPKLNLLDYDQPKGKIVRLDRGGDTAYLNLGSADNVRPGLTFSVFGSDSGGRPTGTRKGAVEVVEVLGERYSRAKVTETTNPSRAPLQTGDYLFNPVWSPDQRTHVAIAGFIDLTGDGRDGTAEFVRQLERHGIVVDAYLDLRNRLVRGEGISRKTNFLVLGEQPEFSATTPLQEGNVITEGIKLIQEKMGQMQDEAKKYGVTIVPFRNFVQLVGFNLPRVPRGGRSAEFYYRSLVPQSTDRQLKESAARKEDQPE